MIRNGLREEVSQVVKVITLELPLLTHLYDIILSGYNSIKKVGV